MKFKTKSGKVELFSQTMADAGLPPLPDYEPPEEPPSGYFRLLFGRSPVHTFSRTTNNPRLLEVVPENELWMNTEMARVMGFKNGQRVMLENQDSVKTGPIKLKVTQRIRQDCVYMVHGFGREDKRLRRAYKKGAADSRLVTRVKRDPVMGGTGMNVNFVTVYRATSKEA
jgi:thiosulfate reductase/polysulfide reductase chain A